MPGNSWPSVFSRYKDQDSLETEWVRRKQLDYKLCRCAHHQRMEWDGVGWGKPGRVSAIFSGITKCRRNQRWGGIWSPGSLP